MRPIHRVVTSTIMGAAALVGGLGLARTLELGPYHHQISPTESAMDQREAALDQLDANLRTALASPLPGLPPLISARRAVPRAATTSGSRSIVFRPSASGSATSVPGTPAGTTPGPAPAPRRAGTRLPVAGSPAGGSVSAPAPVRTTPQTAPASAPPPAPGAASAAAGRDGWHADADPHTDADPDPDAHHPDDHADDRSLAEHAAAERPRREG
jgi:hypothetical protein